MNTEFLKETDRWRELLARNIAIHNQSLSEPELNYAVCTIIDRIIFLRMCEDRGWEACGQLLSLCSANTEPQASARGHHAGPVAHASGSERGPSYQRLGELFHRAGKRYKSSLFHFLDEKGRVGQPDQLTPGLKTDDRVLGDIIEGLYRLESLGESSVLPAETLGQVYEHFLGSIIRLTEGRGVVVEESPQVKKTGGVYYTPTHVVDYIVEQTLGKLLEEGPPTPSPLRILDPACGSGFFLLAVYEYLLRWHLDHYATHHREAWTRVENPQSIPGNHQSSIVNRQSSYRLSFAERKRILLESIFGVDLDPQAVEITKRSLLLKLLEGGPPPTPNNRLPSVHELRMPDLSHNIKCGNSLIGPDFHGHSKPRQAKLEGRSGLDTADQSRARKKAVRVDTRRPPLPHGRGSDCSGESNGATSSQKRRYVNAFDWHAEFPDIFQQSPERKRRVSHQRGGGSPVDDETAVGPVAHAPGSDPNAGFDVVIGNPPYLSFSGRQAAELSEEERHYFAANYQSGGWMTAHGLFIERAVRDLSRRYTAFIVPDQVGHLDGYRPLREAVSRHAGLVEVRYWGEDVFGGVVTPALTFVADRAHRGDTLIQQPGDESARHAPCEGGLAWEASATDDLLSKLRRGSQSLGELVADPGVHTGNCSKKLILPATLSPATSSPATSSPAKSSPAKSIPTTFSPVACDGSGPHCVPVLEGKQVSRYCCRSPTKLLNLDYRAEPGEYFTIRTKQKYTDAPFVIRQTAAHPIVGPREHADYFRNSLLALYRPQDGTDVRYLVGLLNSRLIRYVYRRTVRESRQKAFPQVKVRSLRDLPIRKIDPARPKDKAIHNRMVALVQQLLDLHKQLAAQETSEVKTATQRKIDAIDRQIDNLAYELYGLTDDDIRVVEKATQ